VYEAWEKVLLSLVPLLVLAIGFLMYRRVKRPPNGSEDSAASRLAIFYNLAAGIIWGQFFFHSLPNATTYGEFGYRLRSVFFLLGYGIMLGYDRFARTSHSNRNFVGRSGTSKGTEYTLKRDNQLGKFVLFGRSAVEMPLRGRNAAPRWKCRRKRGAPLNARSAPQCAERPPKARSAPILKDAERPPFFIIHSHSLRR